MTAPAEQRDRARNLIRQACELLIQARARPWPWTLAWPAVQADLTVLLEDAVQLYCQAVGAGFSPGDRGRQPSHWAQQLVACPEQCDQILGWLAAGRSAESERVGHAV